MAPEENSKLLEAKDDILRKLFGKKDETANKKNKGTKSKAPTLAMQSDVRLI